MCKSLHERLLLPEFSPVLTIASDVSKANINVSCQDGTHFSFPEVELLLVYIWVNYTIILCSEMCVMFASCCFSV